MLPLHLTLSYYKRPDIQKAIADAAEKKEVAIRFDTHFGKRPDVLHNPGDVMELAKQKASSFHCSEEHWKNPMQLSSTIKKHEMDNLRTGWDLVLDIDCAIFEYSRLAAHFVIKALQFHEIKSISCKFSGNKGFHIAVPFEAFPKTIGQQETRLLFPEAARKIAEYITHMIKPPLGKSIMELENGDVDAIAKKTEKKTTEIIEDITDEGVTTQQLNPEPFLDIDTILIAPRHLYRMPYSLHEKSGLASVPLNPDAVMQFEKQHADPKTLKVSEYIFLDKSKANHEEGANLVVEAFDYCNKVSLEKQDAQPVRAQNFVEIEEAIPEKFFPPCMLHLQKGIVDGKKRAIFAMTNFLSSVGWTHDQIEEYLRKWNAKNEEPLREVYINGQVRHHKATKKKILPPNCDNKVYYVDLGICKPDNLCRKIKNPVSYAIRKAKYAQIEAEKEKQKQKKKEEREFKKKQEKEKKAAEKTNPTATNKSEE